jgi:hypothetical protein
VITGITGATPVPASDDGIISNVNRIDDALVGRRYDYVSPAGTFLKSAAASSSLSRVNKRDAQVRPTTGRDM